jgi:hypothetical protein
MATPRFIPIEVSISAAQEAELFSEFNPVLAMVTAACINVSKERNFTKFGYLAKALDVLLNAAYDQMVWPENPSVGLPMSGRKH